MLDYHWMIESQRFETEERERYHFLRAGWNEPCPVSRPHAYRRRIAALLLGVANWLDPRGAAPAQPVRMNAAWFASLPLHRVGRG